MSKIHKNYGWLNSRPNSSKTWLARAKCITNPGKPQHNSA